MTSPAKEKSKILLVVFDRIPAASGLSGWVREEIEFLSGRYDIDVLSLKSEDLSHIERFHGARLLRVPVGTGPFLAQIKAFQRALSRQLDSEEYSLCHFTSVWEGMVLVSRKNDAKYKLLYEVHSLPSIDFKALYPDQAPQVEHSYPLKQQEERCLSMADHVLAGSELMKKHLVGRGVAQDKITLIRPTVDAARFDLEGVPRQPGSVLYLGSLAPWQGIHSLLMAIAELPHNLPVKLQLVCPAEDPFRKEILGKIQILGLARKAEVIDADLLEDIASRVAAADVCVAPLSNHEHNRRAASTPRKLFVYMACRRPLVSSRQPVVEEIINDGTHGLLYPPGDSHSLADAIKKLLLDRELATTLGNKARLHLEENLSLEDATNSLRAIYRHLSGRTRDTDKSSVVISTDTDTQPGIEDTASAAPVTTEADTSPHSTEAPPGATQVTEDTVPIPLANAGHAGKSRPLPDTDPSPPPVPAEGQTPVPREGTQEDIVFRSVDDEDTAPRRSPENWQVMELSLVSLPSKKPEREEESEKAGKWLLGGPPYRVKSEDEGDTEKLFKAPTRRADQTKPDGLDLLDDSDVQLIDGEPKKPDEPPINPSKKKKK